MWKLEGPWASFLNSLLSVGKDGASDSMQGDLMCNPDDLSDPRLRGCRENAGLFMLLDQPNGELRGEDGTMILRVTAFTSEEKV